MSKWLKSGFAFSQFLPGILLCLLALSIAVMADELKIDHIRFEGNTAFSNKSLREILKAEEGKAFNSKNLKLDEILIANYYTQRGYLDVFVSSGFKKNGNKIDITYRIREGTRKFLKEISIQGNTEASTQGLRNFFKIREGDPFSRTVIEDGLNRMEDYYLNNGKPYALFADTTHFENDSLVVYRLKIHEGPTVYIKEIRYSGRERVKHFLMRREMAIAKGDKYARRLIEKSQSNLYSTGLFRSVEYRIVPLTDDGTEVLLQWKVREKKARWVGYRFGVGYEDAAEKGNLTTFDVTLEGGHRNLFGTARSLSLQVVPSFYFGREVSSAPRTFNNPKNQISLNFVEPWVLNTRTPGTFQIAYSREKPPLTVRPARNLSTSFNIQHQYDNNWGFTSGVAFEQVNVEDSGTLSVDSTQVTDFRELVPGQDRIYSFQLNPVKDRRDNVLNPHIGYITEFRNQILYASSRLQIARQGELVDTSATNLLYKTTASWVRYQKFPGRKKWTLATRARASGMLEIGKRNNIRLIPESERYYIGGSTTIRGYSERGIGAEDLVVSQNGDTQRLPVGGKYLLLLNAEVRVPVWWLFYGEVFLDAGNIWEEWDDIADNPGLKMGTGLGLAVLTPFGPIRFDYGFKILRESGESPGEFHIGISFAF